LTLQRAWGLGKASDAELMQAYHGSLVSLGILPSVGQSIQESDVPPKKSIMPNYSIREYVDVKSWRPQGWNLPSNGVAYELCGHIWYDEGKGCLAVKDHPDGLVNVRLVGATCFRAECPICYQKWASREARRIENKFKRLSRNNAEASVPGLGRPIHVVVGVPEVDAHLMHDDFKSLRDKAYAIAKRAGMKGECFIFHPYANDKMDEETPEKVFIDKSKGDFDMESIRDYYAKMDMHVRFWYIRPHFHIIGYAPRDYDNPANDPFNPELINEIYESTGYIVKNLGVRDSVYLTAFYQLSHCGVKKGFQTVTWVGALSNRNYHKLDPAPKPKPIMAECSVCGAELRSVLWDPDGCIREGTIWKPKIDAPPRAPSPLDDYIEGSYWIDPGGWRYLRDGEKLHSCLVRLKEGHVSPDGRDSS